MSHQRGFALLTVLWLALILGLIAASLSDVARRAARSAQSLEAAAPDTSRLEDIRAIAIFELMRFQTEAILLPFGDIRPMGGGLVQVVPADGLIDLNRASAELLSNLGFDARDRGDYGSLAEADLAPDIATFVTVYSGNSFPDLILAPADLRNLFVAAGITFDSHELEEEDPSRKLDGGVFHVRASTKERALEWIIYLPTPEDGLDQLWYLLESRQISILKQPAT